MTARLTDADRGIIARARRLVDAGATLDALREHTAEMDAALGYARAFGEARHLLGELAAIAERPSGSEDQAAGPGEDTRRLAAIREVLKHFDWEYHDRQLALEAIDRIAEGGQP